MLHYVTTYKHIKIYSLRVHNGYAGCYESYWCLERTFDHLKDAKAYIDSKTVEV